jgi:hypothetical protein
VKALKQPDPSKFKPCPFCGMKVKHHPQVSWRGQYVAAYHKTDCPMNDDSDPPYNFELLLR